MFVSFSPPLIPPPPARRIFCYGFGSCLRPGLTYITLINKGWRAARMSHYGISFGHPAPPALIESHQSPHLARCRVYLFCRLGRLLQTRRPTRLKSRPFVSEHKPGGTLSIPNAPPPTATISPALFAQSLFFFCHTSGREEERLAFQLLHQSSHFSNREMMISS